MNLPAPQCREIRDFPVRRAPAAVFSGAATAGASHECAAPGSL